MNKKILFTFVIGMALTAGLLAGCGNPLQRHSDKMVQKISQELDLSSLQKGKLIILQADMLNLVKSGTNESRASVNDVIALVKSDSLDNAKLDAFGRSMEQRQKAALELFKADLIAFHKTLTPAQKEKAAQLIENAYQKMQGWFK